METATGRQSVHETAAVSGLIVASVFDVRDGKPYSIERELEDHVARREEALQPLIDIDFLGAKMRREGTQEAFYGWLTTMGGQEAVKAAEDQISAHDAVTAQMIGELERVAKIREYRDENLICVNGRSAVAGRLANITTYTGIINYGAVGTSTTDPDVADPQLGTEIARTTVATSAQTTYTAYVNFLFTMASFSGTATEFATFIDGTGSANSGRIWTHVEPVSSWSKSSSEALVVACTYPLTYVP